MIAVLIAACGGSERSAEEHHALASAYRADINGLLTGLMRNNTLELADLPAGWRRSLRPSDKEITSGFPMCPTGHSLPLQAVSLITISLFDDPSSQTRVQQVLFEAPSGLAWMEALRANVARCSAWTIYVPGARTEAEYVGEISGAGEYGSDSIAIHLSLAPGESVAPRFIDMAFVRHGGIIHWIALSASESRLPGRVFGIIVRLAETKLTRTPDGLEPLVIPD